MDSQVELVTLGTRQPPSTHSELPPDSRASSAEADRPDDASYRAVGTHDHGDDTEHRAMLRDAHARGALKQSRVRTAGRWAKMTHGMTRQG
jgi:hypothetical protein